MSSASVLSVWGAFMEDGGDSTQRVSIPLPTHSESQTLVSCGGSHLLYCLRMSNTFHAMGSNKFGQLGVEHDPCNGVVPVSIPLDAGTIAGLACGSRHSVVWTSLGHAFAFGSNFYSQLGCSSTQLMYKSDQV